MIGEVKYFTQFNSEPSLSLARFCLAYFLHFRLGMDELKVFHISFQFLIFVEKLQFFITNRIVKLTVISVSG